MRYPGSPLLSSAKAAITFAVAETGRAALAIELACASTDVAFTGATTQRTRLQLCHLDPSSPITSEDSCDSASGGRQLGMVVRTSARLSASRIWETNLAFWTPLPVVSPSLRATVREPGQGCQLRLTPAARSASGSASQWPRWLTCPGVFRRLLEYLLGGMIA